MLWEDAPGRCSWKMLWEDALGRCSWKMLWEDALGRCSWKMLWEDAPGRCSWKMLLEDALGRCSGKMLLEDALGRCCGSVMTSYKDPLRAGGGPTQGFPPGGWSLLLCHVVCDVCHFRLHLLYIFILSRTMIFAKPYQALRFKFPTSTNVLVRHSY